MSFIYATLAKEVDGQVEYVYPKTTAEIIEFDSSDSVKTKINKIDKNIDDVNKRINNIVNAIDYGTLGTYNDAELINIRVPNYNVVEEDTEFNNAGDAIRGQFEAILDLINSIKKDNEEFKNTIIAEINDIKAQL